MSDAFYGEFTTDLTPPTTANPFPLPGAITIPTNTAISIDISDTETGVDLDAVVITVESVIAYENGSQQNGFTVTVTGSSASYNF